MLQEGLFLANLLLAFYALCILSVKATSTFSLFSDTSGFVCPVEFILFEKKTSVIACMLLCENDGSCEGVDYNEETKLCHGCKGLKEANCLYKPSTTNKTNGTRMYSKDTNSFLVSGMVPLPDDHLRESSYWYTTGTNYHTSYHARYCKVNTNSATAAWVVSSTQMNQHQWIQARFLHLAVVRGIYLLPRDKPGYFHYVTSYKLLYSVDCSVYHVCSPSNGTILEFQGNPDGQTAITTNLPSPISALCIRINPTRWFYNIALRFDVIGRYP